MNKIYINTKNVDEILNSPKIKEEYEKIYIQSLEKTKYVFEIELGEGLFVIAKEIFVNDDFLFRSIILEIDKLKQNVIAFNGDNTLFYYISEKTSKIERKLQEENLDDLVDFMSKKYDFEKLELDDDIAFLLNNPRKLCMAEESLNKMKIESLLENGVFIKNPSTVRIDTEAVVESGVVIGSGVIIKGNSYISKGSFIENSSYIENSKLGENSYVLSSTILDSVVEDNCKIGPYAQIRPNSHIYNDVKLGNFVEIKNSNIGDGTKVSHLSYIGDSDLGKDINVGCGVVFVNYDGVKKFRSSIGDDVFIGCNSNLISPIEVGDGAYIAAGSTITDDVEKEQLAIARSRQINKDGWKLKSKIDKEQE